MKNLFITIFLLGIFLLPTPGMVDESKEDTLKILSQKRCTSLMKFFTPHLTIWGEKIGVDGTPCLPEDIVQFNVTTKKAGLDILPALQIKGTVKIGELPPPFETLGKTYILYLQAFLLSPEGRVVWGRDGMPTNSLIGAKGGSRSFTLIDAFSGSVDGYTVLIVAAGGPVFKTDTRGDGTVILGAELIKIVELK